VAIKKIYVNIVRFCKGKQVYEGCSWNTYQKQSCYGKSINDNILDTSLWVAKAMLTAEKAS